jgi:hypothetical protein
MILVRLHRNFKLAIAMSARVIQVRQSRNPRWKKQGGWEVYEAEGVCPVYCGKNGRDQALSYAKQRAGYGRAEIQVLDDAWNVVETIANEETRPLV